MNSTTLNRLLACTALIGVSALASQAYAAGDGTTAVGAPVSPVVATDANGLLISTDVASTTVINATAADIVLGAEGAANSDAVTLTTDAATNVAIVINVSNGDLTKVVTFAGDIENEDANSTLTINLLAVNSTVLSGDVATAGGAIAINLGAAGAVATTHLLTVDTVSAQDLSIDGTISAAEALDTANLTILNSVDGANSVTFTKDIGGATAATALDAIVVGLDANDDALSVIFGAGVNAATIVIDDGGDAFANAHSVKFGTAAATSTVTLSGAGISGAGAGDTNTLTFVGGSTVIFNAAVGTGIDFIQVGADATNTNVTFKAGIASGPITIGAGAGTVDTNTVTFDTTTAAFTVTPAIAGGDAADINNVVILGGKTLTTVGGFGANIDSVTISGAGTVLTGNLTFGDGDDSVTNTGGTIIGNTILGNGANSFTQTGAGVTTGNITGGTGVDTITLAGTLTGNVIGGGGNDIFASTAKITGNLTFGDGNDSVTNTGGTIIGNTILGNGVNFFTQTGAGVTTGNVTGGTGVDTLALAGTMTGNFIGGGGDDVFGNTGAFTGSINSAAGNVAVTNGAGGVLTINAPSNLGAGAITNAAAVAGPPALAAGILNVGTLLAGTTLTTTGALTNLGTVNLFAGSVLSAAIGPLNTGTFNSTINDTNAVLALTDIGSLASLGAIDLSAASVNFNIIGDVGLTAGLVTPVVFANGVGPAVLPLAAKVTDNHSLYVTTLSLGADTSDIILNVAVVAGGFATLTASPNTDAVATAIQALSANPALIVAGPAGDGVRALVAAFTAQGLTPAQAEAIAQQSLPPHDGGASIHSAMTFASRTAGVVSSQLRSARLEGDAVSGISAGDNGQGARFWLQAFGSAGEQDPRDGVNGYEADSYGFAAGIDTRSFASNSVVGLAFSYNNADIDSFNLNTTNTEIDSYQGTVYGSMGLGNMNYVSGMVGYVWSDNDTSRNIAAIGLIPASVSSGNYDSDQFVANLELGHDVKSGIMTFTPNVFANYGNYSADDYAETGPLGINVATEDMDLFELGIGADVTWDIKQSGDGILRPSLSASYRYDFIADEINSTSSFTGAPGVSFKTTGAEPEENKFTLGGGLKYFDHQWELSANYGFDYMEDYDAHSGMVRAGFNF